jgi:hypothetical protein
MTGSKALKFKYCFKKKSCDFAGRGISFAQNELPILRKIILFFTAKRAKIALQIKKSFNSIFQEAKNET